ncbi:hypothetical protein ACJ41O_005675 [Fusarium nematophilum]
MPNPKHFALLIGVDFYLRYPLHSCVRDVDLVEAHLKTLQAEKRFDVLEITRLTASNPTGQDPCPSKPPESDETVATLDNIRKNLTRLASQSTEGDHVYVHFSGHGTELPNGALGLVPFGCEDDQNGCLRDCLTGEELAKLLNRIVSKGVKVLAVLDCCYSGRIPRRKLPDAVRYIPFACSPDAESAELPSGQAHWDVVSSNTTFRGASVRHNWLMDPKGYTILTACGPKQTTKALSFGDEKLNGALTITLVRTLERLGPLNMSHMVIFQFICARFKAMNFSEIPQLKGTGDFTFFGYLNGPDDSFFPIVKFRTGEMMLQAGEIMGIHENDHLVLSCLSIFADEPRNSKHVLATARNVRAVTSDIKLDDSAPGNINAGWVARPLKLCQDALAASDAAANNTRGQDIRLQERVLFPPGFTETTAPFKARINDEGVFDIQDRDDRKIDFDGLSLLPVDSPSTRPQVLRVLAYLARCHEIVNMKPLVENETLLTTIDIKLCDASGVPFPEIKVTNVQQEEIIMLHIDNNGQESVFVHILHLSEDWEIQNVLKEGNTELLPKQIGKQIALGIQMTIPPQHILRGIRSCEDTLKVFITAKPAPFAHFSAARPILRGSSVKQGELLDSWTARTFHIHTAMPVALPL